MSRQLPEKPNFEYLQKQAKQLLSSMPQGKLAQAQQQLANEYGFNSWAKLKAHVLDAARTPAKALETAVCDSDAARVTDLLQRYPELRAKIDNPLPHYGFGQHALFAAVQRSDRATIDALLKAGSNINKRTEWWAGGFGVLDECDPEMVTLLTERGAVMDPHGAARLGLVAELRQMLSVDPGVVHAKGGDGQTPLHFASTIEIAALLLANGAEIDARDADHESTPAQYMLRVEHSRHYHHDRQDVARYLISQGCRTDLLMASALGNLELVRRHLDDDPACIAMKVSEEWFPKQDPRAGGTIYIWKLGANRTAHSVAREFGHEEVFELLMERTTPAMKLALACELGDKAVFEELLRNKPDLASRLSTEEQRKLPDAAQNNNTEAVRLMLAAGWPVDTQGEMGATALHWAAFNGNAKMAKDILRFKPTLELKSKDYESTALAWAVFGSGNSWRRNSGDFRGVVQALKEAGAVSPPCPEDLEPSETVMDELEKFA